MKKKRGHKVGYGKPPVSGQFKKGKSGNPKGRPKGSRNFDTELDEVMGVLVSVTEDGKPKKVTSRQAILMQLRALALQGKLGAIEKFLALAQGRNERLAANGAEQKLNANDDNILDRFEEDLLKAANRNSKEEGSGDEQD